MGSEPADNSPIDGGDLFDGVVYYLSPSLKSDIVESIRGILSANSGREVMRRNAHQATHIISVSHGLESADLDPKLPSVPAQVVVTIPPGDREVIAAGIQSLGGQWRYGLTREVTHLFTLSPTGEKYDSAMHYYALVKHPYIVTPHWFDDSIKCRRRQNVDQYLFPDPDVLRSGFSLDSWEFRRNSEMRVIWRTDFVDYPTQRLFGATSALQAQNEKQLIVVRTEWRASHPNDNIWDGRRVLLSSLLQMGKGRRQAVESELVKAGAKIVDPQTLDASSFDVLIVPHADGPHFEMAETNGEKLIGTLAWLFHVHGTGRFTSPHDHLLHMPRPIGSIPGFKGKRISLTNYAGHSREFLKELIVRVGADFSGELKHRECDILIAATTFGKKVERAMQWTIPVVNHTWLEDCFRQWRYIEPSAKLGAYTVFPPGVDWSDSLDLRAHDSDRSAVHPGPPAPSTPVRQPSPGPSKANAASTRLPSSNRVSEDPFAASFKPMEVVEPIPPLSSERGGSILEIERTVTDVAGTLEPSSALPSTVMDISDDEVPGPVATETLSQPQAADDMAVDSPPSNINVGQEVRQTASPPLSDRDDTPRKNSSLYPRRSNRSIPRSQVIPLDLDDDSDQAPDADELIRRSYAKSQAKLTSTSPQQLLRNEDTKDEPTSKQIGTSQTTKSTERTVEITQERDSEYRDPKSVVATNGAPVEVRSSKIDNDAPLKSKKPNSKPPRPTKEEEDRVYREVAEAYRQRSSGRVPKRPLLPTNPTMNRLPPEEKARLQREREKAASLNPKKAQVLQRKRAAVDNANSGSSKHVQMGALASRRAAAMKAEKGLSTQMEDANAFAASLKSSRGDIRRLSLGKRSREEDTNSSSESSEAEKDRKVRKIEAKITGAEKVDKGKNRETADVRVLVTMCNIEAAVQKTLKKLGVAFTEDPDKCTHIVSKGIVRTQKFVRAMCVVKFALMPSWLEDSAKVGRLLGEESYWIQDKEKETQFNFNLKATLTKDRSVPVFDGITFYTTEKIGMDFDTLKHVVTSAGGQLLKSLSPSAKILRKPNCYLVSSPEDRKVWEDLKHADGSPLPVYNFHFVVNSVLRQQLDWDGEVQPVRVDGDA
ncbi:uncharacterized protein EI90DRAFT_3287772 [Cantharellus anzutake]|uniref:uncharacterized protein n=1 Tax=Cantharellus anzutake TaxID=1750568 RepID=UPI00190409E3|nr:uncharacterized protein EI90DRAFT_3287772 [Cantharellus anzutake]KAF8335877.1 hypothetical protein EI90DRAFT_3287772 [Cantharellus anzutake]